MRPYSADRLDPTVAIVLRDGIWWEAAPGLPAEGYPGRGPL